MNNIKKLLNHDVVVRAFKTFCQAYVGAWLVFQDPFSKGAIAAGIAAGVSAVWNLMVKK